MNQFDPIAFLQNMARQGLEPRPYLIFAAAVLLSLLLFYFLRRRRYVPTDDGAITRESPQAPGDRIMREAFVIADRKPAATQATLPEPATSQATEKFYPNAPQDSVLRRHFVTHVRYMIEAVTFPRPTDSVLRRHHEQLIESELEACLTDAANLQRLLSRYEAHRKNTADLHAAPGRETSAEHAAARETAAPIDVAAVADPAASSAHVPQDSVLRRHYETQARYMIETVTFPRPADSVLRRHYDQLIASRLDACLNNEAHMNRLICEYETLRNRA